MNISTQNPDLSFVPFEFDLEKTPDDIWQHTVENDVPTEFLDQFLVFDSNPSSDTTTDVGASLSPIPSAEILPDTVLPSIEGCDSSPQLTEPIYNDLSSLAGPDFLALDNDPLFSETDSTNTQEWISDSDLLKLEGITIHSPQKSQLDLSSAPPSPIGSTTSKWKDNIHGTVRRATNSRSPVKDYAEDPATVFRIEDPASLQLPPSPPLSTLLEGSKPPLEHVSFVNGQLEDPFLDPALAPAPLISPSNNEQDGPVKTALADGSSSMFYAPGFKPFTPQRQHLASNPVPQPLHIHKHRHNAQHPLNPQHPQHHPHQQQRRPAPLQLHNPQGNGPRALSSAAPTSLGPDSAGWPLTSPGFRQQDRQYSAQQNMTSSPGWWDPSTTANAHANARSATLNLNMQLLDAPEINGFYPGNHTNIPLSAPTAPVPVPRLHNQQDMNGRASGLMIQMPQPQRPQSQAVVLNKLVSQGTHIYFPPPPPPPPPPGQQPQPHSLMSPQHHILPGAPAAATTAIRSERRRPRCPNTRDRYQGLGTGAGTPTRRVSGGRGGRGDSTSPTPGLRRSTSMGMLDAGSRGQQHGHHLHHPNHHAGHAAVRKRRSWTRGGGGGGGGGGPDPFVNYTPNDHKALMRGVAPSGSSKTKARRDREAMEKGRRIGEMAINAVMAAGGDVDSLVQVGLDLA